MHLKQMLPEGASVAILGAGMSGRAAASLALSLGYKAQLFDQKDRDAVSVFDADCAQAFAAIIISPGFAASHPWRLAAHGSGKPCFGELGFAAWHWKGKLYAVTGTNGKTSTTQLFQQACEAAGYYAVAVGNIGAPLSEAVMSDQNNEEAVAICEISSFQAECPRGLELDALLWLNFSEDHLDRYPSMQAYFLAKANLLDCLKAEAPAVAPASIRPFFRDNLQAHKLHFFADEMPADNSLDSASPFCRQPFYQNFQLLAGLWSLLALPESSLVQAANHSRLPEHRLQRVASSDLLYVWDDSKATNFDASLAAVRALAPQPIVWIGGGASKGGDLHGFIARLAPHIQQAFVYGEVAADLQAVLSQHSVPCSYDSDFLNAVQAALAFSLHPRTDGQAWQLLLSPGFSSLDQFISYAERGKYFQSIVFGLMPTQNMPLLDSSNFSTL